MPLSKSILVFSLNTFVRDFCRKQLKLYNLEFYSTWDKLYNNSRTAQLILIDYSFIAYNGPQFLENLCLPKPPAPIIILTNQDCSFFTEWFYKIGVKHIISLPCHEDRFKKILFPYLHFPAKQQDFIPPPAFACPNLERFLGDTLKMQELKRLVYHLSQTDTPLLLTGESGTGKTYLAKIIHEMSPRMHHPFCAVNVASIPVSLAEAELFGTTKGAYTNAITREGYFSAAKFGTLFLDEIGDLSPTIQPKLLQVLEERTYNKIGSTSLLKCDTRFIFATNVNLHHLVDQGAFRRDLYYRISILPIEVPPLRERKADIPRLAQHFLAPYQKDLSSTCIQKLMDHHWPGNIRELKNCLVRASILSTKETIHEAHISF